MATVTASADVERPPETVWQALLAPERWLDGYVRTRSRSADYPQPKARSEFVFHTRVDEDVAAEVLRCEPPSLLEERQVGKTFIRHVRYSLAPANGSTHVTIDDEISFKGLAKLAAPLVMRDVKQRWEVSLARLQGAAMTPPATGSPA